MTIIQAHFAAYSEPDFRSRVEYLVVKAAVAVTTESPLTENHAERLVLAHLILDGSLGYVTRFALGALTNPTLLAANNHAAITDNDLEFTINSIYNSFANI